MRAKAFLHFRLLPFVKKEAVFLAALALTALASLFAAPQVSEIRWNVISALFCLMLVCAGFEKCNALIFLAGRAIRAFRTPRLLGLALILVTGALAMLVTNDVALLAVVPLTMVIARMSGENPSLLVILETLSANVLSALTPFGNPQNLYLYSYYSIPTGEFFAITAPFCAFGLLLILLANLLFNGGGSYETSAPLAQLNNKPLLLVSAAGFCLNILSILRVLDFRIALAATLILFLVFAPRLLLRVDWFLLLTFVCFFLFTSSVTQIPPVRALFARALTTPASVLLGAAAASQVISNVPAAALLAGFTGHYRELLLGVSAGGLGTLVASLASLISYRIYAAEYAVKKYLRAFTVLNAGLLALLLGFLLLWPW